MDGLPCASVRARASDDREADSPVQTRSDVVWFAVASLPGKQPVLCLRENKRAYAGHHTMAFKANLLTRMQRLRVSWNPHGLQMGRTAVSLLSGVHIATVCLPCEVEDGGCSAGCSRFHTVGAWLSAKVAGLIKAAAKKHMSTGFMLASQKLSLSSTAKCMPTLTFAASSGVKKNVGTNQQGNMQQ